MLAPLDNETIFKKAFTNKEVFQQFVKDIFGVEINVNKIETEKKFTPKIGHIDIKIDVYAETTDHRFIIEIQKIDYDYNFSRFLHYFLMVLADQQKSAEEYEPEQQVLGVVILTSPYKIHEKTGKPIKDNVLTIDFNPRNLQDELIKLWEHNLVFLNPNPKYKNEKTPKKFQDWLDLFALSIDKKQDKLTINLNNSGIAKVAELIAYEKLDPVTLDQMKIDNSRKAMIKIIENEGKIEGKIEIAKKMIKANKPIEEIIEFTELTRDIIEQLINEMNNK
jgi:predicted transposase/invertase (TIGR01784 family)